MSERTLELNDGQIIATYEAETFEVLGVEDWNGNEASHRWFQIAQERVDELRLE